MPQCSVSKIQILTSYSSNKYFQLFPSATYGIHLNFIRTWFKTFHNLSSTSPPPTVLPTPGALAFPWTYIVFLCMGSPSTWNGFHPFLILSKSYSFTRSQLKSPPNLQRPILPPSAFSQHFEHIPIVKCISTSSTSWRSLKASWQFIHSGKSYLAPTVP